MLESRFGIRTHFGLFMLSKTYERRYGGVGVSIPDIGGSIRLEKSSSPKTKVKINGAIDESLTDFASILSRELNINNTYLFEVNSLVQRHTGFGTGTSIRLSIIDLLNSKEKLMLTRQDYLRMSRRGGASGVGLKAFFDDGLIVDLGRKVSNKEPLLPSSESISISAHQYLNSTNIPWNMVLGIPKKTGNTFGIQEKKLFSQYCAINKDNDKLLLWDIIMGIYLSCIEIDYEAFVKSIFKFQNTEWKNYVKKNLPIEYVHEIESLSNELNIPLFISSWGPGFVGFTYDLKKKKSIKKLMETELYMILEI